MSTTVSRLMPRLMAEIEAYLAFMDEARRDDSLWREHVAWRSKETLRERIEAYSLRDRK